MSLEAPNRNKMMTAPPVKKGFHFASDGLHFAEFIEAETVEEATAIYQKTKRLLFPTGDTAIIPAQQSTDASLKQEDDAEL